MEQNQGESKTFYEAMSGSYRHGHSTYRELLLTDSEESNRRIRYFRPPAWALFSARIETVPSSMDEASRHDDANTLLSVCVAGGPGQHRYDRVIILKRGDHDDVSPLVEFFRKWLPQLVEEKRVFLAAVPENLRRDRVERAVGAAVPIDWSLAAME